MNIYLTSYGLDTRYERYMNSYNNIINLLKGKKVAIIPNAKLISEDRTNSMVAKNELDRNNINADIIDIEHSNISLKYYDALYLSGGEPKNLMDAINHTNKFNEIKNFVEEGKIVIGQSAGAMIFNREYLDTTTGELKIMRNGFDFGKKIIVPHYDNLPEELLNKIPIEVFKINDSDDLIKLI